MHICLHKDIKDKVSKAEKSNENKSENKKLDVCASLHTACKTAKVPKSKIKQTKETRMLLQKIFCGLCKHPTLI